jgi:hypothetical protein
MSLTAATLARPSIAGPPVATICMVISNVSFVGNAIRHERQQRVSYWVMLRQLRGALCMGVGMYTVAELRSLA